MYLLETAYVGMVDHCTLMGYLLNSPVLRVDSLFFCALNKHISKAASVKNAEYLNMINECVKDKALYFARDFSLTRNIQGIVDGITQQKFTARDLPTTYSDDRFFFNKTHSTYLIQNGMQALITPLIYGFFAVHIVHLTE